MGNCCGVPQDTKETDTEIGSTSKKSDRKNASGDSSEVKLSNITIHNRTQSTDITIQRPASSSFEISSAISPVDKTLTNTAANSLVSKMKVKRNFCMDDVDDQPKHPPEDLDRAVFASQLSFAHQFSKRSMRHSPESKVLSGTEIAESISDNPLTKTPEQVSQILLSSQELSPSLLTPNPSVLNPESEVPSSSAPL
jgi:hypothetical protein